MDPTTIIAAAAPVIDAAATVIGHLVENIGSPRAQACATEIMALLGPDAQIEIVAKTQLASVQALAQQLAATTASGSGG